MPVGYNNKLKKYKMKAWIKAFRLRSLPLALACISMGSILAYADGKMNWAVAILSLVTTVFLQILSNLANDYGDAISGVDSPDRQGPSRAVHTGEITAKAMFRAIVIFGILSFVSGISLLLMGLSIDIQFFIFLTIGLVAIAAAIKYTMGKNPYGYAGFGDLSVFLFFGIVGVMGTYYLHTGTWSSLGVLPALSCSFFAVAVLNVNNIRDIESDKLAGKNSIPVRLGRDRAVIYHYFLLLAGILCSLIYVFLSYKGPFQFLFLLVLPLLYINGKAVHTMHEASKLDPYLKQMALTTLLFVVCFGLGNVLYAG